MVKSHVLPALLRKFITAKRKNDSEVVIWGLGNPKREFLHVDNLGDDCLFLMENYNEAGLVNIGIGIDLVIHELANLIKKLVDYNGGIVYDFSKPDGTSQKLMDITKLTKFGWKEKIDLLLLKK